MNTKLLRKVPGFRSGTWWHAALAGFWYGALLVSGVAQTVAGDLAAPLAAIAAVLLSAFVIHLAPKAPRPGNLLRRAGEWQRNQDQAAKDRSADRKRRQAERASPEAAARREERRDEQQRRRAERKAHNEERRQEFKARRRAQTEERKARAQARSEEFKRKQEEKRRRIVAEAAASAAEGGEVPLVFGNVGSWQDAEQLVARWMQAHGFPDAVAAPGGADGGVDVRSGAAYAQVKYFSASAVGRPDVQRIFGVASADGREPFFFANAALGYSQGAQEWAEKFGVALFTFSVAGEVRAANGYAQEVVQRRSPTTVKVRAGARSEAKHAAREERARRKEFDSRMRALLNRTTVAALRRVVDALYEDLPPGERIEAAMSWKPKGLLVLTPREVLSYELLGPQVVLQSWHFAQLRRIETKRLNTRLEITVGGTTREYRGLSKEVEPFAKQLATRIGAWPGHTA